MTSTERAIQAATEVIAKIRHSWSRTVSSPNVQHEDRVFAQRAVEAALATGELHAADECPNREALSEQKAESRQVIGLLERQIKQMEVEADSIMAAELERHRRANLLRVATDDPENVEYFLAVRDQLVDDEVVRNTKVETVKDVVLVIGQGIDRLEERAEKAEAELRRTKERLGTEMMCLDELRDRGRQQDLEQIYQLESELADLKAKIERSEDDVDRFVSLEELRRVKMESEHHRPWRLRDVMKRKPKE